MSPPFKIELPDGRASPSLLGWRHVVDPIVGTATSAGAVAVLAVLRSRSTATTSAAIGIDPLMWPVWLVPLVTVVGTTALVIVAARRFGWGRGPIAAACAGSIALGLALGEVDALSRVVGPVEDISGHIIDRGPAYLFVRAVASDDCHLQARLVPQPGGKWRARAQFGGPPGGEFEIIVVVMRQPLSDGARIVKCTQLEIDTDRAVRSVVKA